MKQKNLHKIGVYKIVNLVSGRIYVGSTASSFATRFRHHKYDLNNNRHHNSKLQRAWNKYGADAFCFEIIELCEVKEDVLKREQHYIDTLSPFYNECQIAGSNLGCKLSDDTRKKIGEKNKGNTVWRGRTHTEEAKQKIAAANKGRAPWTAGKKVSAEVANKIAETLRGRKHSEKSKQKMSESRIGKEPWNKGVKGVMQAWNKGKPWSEETRRNMSLARQRFLNNQKEAIQ